MKYKGIQQRVYDSKDLKFRAVEGENKEMILEGYAALFNVRSKLLYNSFYEVIERKAFDEVLKSKELDVVLNFNHDNNLVMGRTTNGTLELSTDETGLFFRAVLPDTTYARDVYELVKRGDIFQNSFAFMPAKDGYRAETSEDGNDLYTVTRVERLRDVSAVTFPAYSETTLSARELKDPSTGEVIPSVEIATEKLNEILVTFKALDELLSGIAPSEEPEEPEEAPEEVAEDDPSTGAADEENRKLNEIYKMRSQLAKIKYLK